MPDMEKVIKGLELHEKRPSGCLECPYADEEGRTDGWCIHGLHRDILALLKEQEPKQIEAEEIDEIGRLYRCPSCHMAMMLRKQPYCHSCGQAVKWDA